MTRLQNTMRQIFFAALLSGFALSLAFVTTLSTARAAQDAPLISEQKAASYGLTRGWFNQLSIDPNRSKVLHVTLEGGQMFLVTDDGLLHALNAETGETQWVRTIGSRDTLLEEPAVNSRMVAVATQSEVFICNRNNGNLLLQLPLATASSAGCELSENFVYIPLINRRIVAFRLSDDNEMTKKASASAERAVQTPLTLPEEDEVLAKIQASFQETKDKLYAEAQPPAKEQEIFLHTPSGLPLMCQSFGMSTFRPLLSSQLAYFARTDEKSKTVPRNDLLLWVTENGLIVGGGIKFSVSETLNASMFEDRLDLSFTVNASSSNYAVTPTHTVAVRQDIDSIFRARPTTNQALPLIAKKDEPEANDIPSVALVGTKEGSLFAIEDRAGEVMWNFTAKGPIVQRVAVIATDVYCPCEKGLHALDLLTGKEKWPMAPGVTKFIAATKERIYGTDDLGCMIVLDRGTGQKLSSFSVKNFDKILFNIETDRLYFLTNTGLIQCLYEQRLQGLNAELSDLVPQPLRHRYSLKECAKALAGETTPPLYWTATEAGDAMGTVVNITTKTEEDTADGAADGDDFDPFGESSSDDVEDKEADKAREEADLLDESNPFGN